MTEIRHHQPIRATLKLEGAGSWTADDDMLVVLGGHAGFGPSAVSAAKFLTCEHLRTWRQVLLDSARMILRVHCFGRQSLVLLEVILSQFSFKCIPVSGSRI